MPSLIAFGRRWNISSDDFVFPEISEALFRASWMLITSASFVFHSPFDCHSLEWLTYLAMLLLWNAVTAALCVRIAWQSSRGSILDSSARKGVVPLIYLRVPLFVGEIIYTVFSAIFAFGDAQTDEACFSRTALQITIGLELFLILCVLFGVVVVFNPLGDHNVDRSVMVEHRYWSSRLKIAIDEIASLLAAFFADTDFVLSDIAAGLLLMVHNPEQRPAADDTLSPGTLDSPLPDWMNLTNSFGTMARMMDFVVAVYGWPTFMLNNCGCGAWCRLWKQVRCCGRCRSYDPVIVEDNCFLCHTAAFQLESDLDGSEIYFVSFRNRLYQVPFVVLTDRRTGSIVVTIRGSASVLDLVTDLSLSEDVFSVDVDSDPILREDQQLESEGQVRVHRGMLHSARYVYNTLRTQHVLEDLSEAHPDYELVICGHSLGAGVASLLTLLLKQTYPNVRCYAFSPPGCVISEHGIPDMESHVLSVIVGDDLIPRISYQSLIQLKYSIDEQLYSTTKAKYEILIKGLYKLFFAAPWDLSSDATPSLRSSRRLIEPTESYGTERRASDASGSASAQLTTARTRLFPPGRLLHLSAQPAGVAISWIRKEFLGEIQLSGAILADHMPYRVRRTIQRARDENGFV